MFAIMNIQAFSQKSRGFRLWLDKHLGIIAQRSVLSLAEYEKRIIFAEVQSRDEMPWITIFTGPEIPIIDIDLIRGLRKRPRFGEPMGSSREAVAVSYSLPSWSMAEVTVLQRLSHGETCRRREHIPIGPG
jgi:hypothetical protein